MKSPKTGGKSPGAPQKAATTAHLIETAAHHLGHTQRHLQRLSKPQTAKQKALDHEHATTHLKGGMEHVQKLMDHVVSNYPAEGKELQTIQNTVPNTIKSRVHKAMKKGK